jgi:hypothetical protein
MVRTGQDWAPSQFCPSWEHALLGGYETGMHHSNARLSIYGMGDTPAFVIKGYAPLVTCVSLYLCNRRRTIVMCVSLLSHVSLYLRNQRCAIGTCV